MPSLTPAPTTTVGRGLFPRAGLHPRPGLYPGSGTNVAAPTSTGTLTPA